MEPIRNDVDDYFDGLTNELATFEMPNDDPDQVWSDEASNRIRHLWQRTRLGPGFARWNSSPEREQVLTIARSDPSELHAQSSRLVWEALAAIVTQDAYDDVALIADREAAAHLANELRSRLLMDKEGALAAIGPPVSTGYPLNPVPGKGTDLEGE